MDSHFRGNDIAFGQVCSGEGADSVKSGLYSGGEDGFPLSWE